MENVETIGEVNETFVSGDGFLLENLGVDGSSVYQEHNYSIHVVEPEISEPKCDVVENLYVVNEMGGETLNEVSIENVLISDPSFGEISYNEMINNDSAIHVNNDQLTLSQEYDRFVAELFADDNLISELPWEEMAAVEIPAALEPNLLGNDPLWGGDIIESNLGNENISVPQELDVVLEDLIEYYDF